ncbi:amylo-alpha-1,6-glucosidase [Pseudoflavitalea sp. X16]|uniref:amylo-alpha-1,6-glucosidase n=1 Tax=Paraflavitalea devenefica TaxID=2716334 RepID=UPI001421FFB3|nr:amylo-alpha-1,6-glucosidase [Paraflavitalea devenefica]NII26567.1 amylo-alpha-1,6-glucosidase [Paraflavitalea devenefica]
MQAGHPETADNKFHISAEAVNTDDLNQVINHYNTFGVFDQTGNISPGGKNVRGIYHDGTRFLNRLVLAMEEKRPLLLSSAIKEDNEIISIDLTNPVLNDCIPENTLHISRTQFIRNKAFYEELRCMNYDERECQVTFSLTFGADFKDIFEIRGLDRKVKANDTSCHAETDRIIFRYQGHDDLQRETSIVFVTEVAFYIISNSVHFKLHLQPKQQVIINYTVYFKTGNEKNADIDFQVARESIEEEINKTRGLFANIYTSNSQFNHWINRSRADILSLLTQTEYGNYPYAGVPWYNTAFGRDGLITAMETLWLAPEVSKDVLIFLAQKQATQLIPSKDAEPGKILHEMRSGEMANTGEIPFKEYYGTIDATPLFVMLAGMYYERTADEATIKRLWPHIMAALDWIDKYGDVDGDGLVEYQHKAENGLTNQGWKDSFDSIMHEDGQLAPPPIALCEVQGYVYSAKYYAATLAKHFNEPALSEKLFKEAASLKEQFNKRFWDEALKCFVIALDGNKRPCRVVSSNAGHCLFTRIANEENARKLAGTLLDSDMFTGWGIRTLSDREHRYNPMSYHNGSVWPHDNALIAYGLSIYNYQDHALKIMQGMFDASLFIDLQRLPELFCGFERRRGEGPTSYPVACSPQAWSVAVVFMMLQTCFRININALTKVITFEKPILPPYLEHIFISNLRLGNSSCNLNLSRIQFDVGFNLLQKPEDWAVIIKK